jgi:HPt (histidine-containing phosphotransfer) domain-containing protein
MTMVERSGSNTPCLRGRFLRELRLRDLAVCAIAVLAVSCAPMGGKTPEAGSAMPASIIDPYLAIQSALADDSTDNVKANAANIATAATALGAPAMKIDTTALQLASATELDDARAKFGALSEAIDTYMTGLKLKAPEGVRVAFCPMAQKPWLQEGSAINNPYYGKSMQTCGAFR